MAQPVRSFRPCSTCHLLKSVIKIVREVLYALVRPLIPYESGPRAPEKELPDEVGEAADEQLAQCQAIFDDSEARGCHIEQKAQWTFTALAFLMPAMASILVFLIRDPAFGSVDSSFSFVLVSVSGCLLILSFISALRAMSIRRRDFLHIHSVIDKENGAFLEYKKGFHAQGLLYCAVMNTAINDHIAQFVKGAHVLLAFAVIFFVSGAVIAGYQIIRSATTIDFCGYVICVPHG